MAALIKMGEGPGKDAGRKYSKRQAEDQKQCGIQSFAGV
jgi:hypothetical protein